jgi:DNA-directed RNA polymerase specialized sigma24 family protein
VLTLLFMDGGMSYKAAAPKVRLSTDLVAAMVPEILRQLVVALGVPEAEMDVLPTGGAALADLLAGGGVNLAMSDGKLAPQIAILRAARDEHLDVLRVLVERSRPTRRETFVLWFTGYSVDDIAAERNVERATVYGNLQAAISALAEKLPAAIEEADEKARYAEEAEAARRTKAARQARRLAAVRDIRRAVERDATATERLVLTQASDKALRRALDDLTPKHQAAIFLRYRKNGMSSQEVARALRVGEPEVDHLVRDGIARLAEMLTPDSEVLLLVEAVHAHESALLEPHLGDLSELERECYELYFEQGLSVPEIAARRPSRIRARNSRALTEDGVTARLWRTARTLSDRLPIEVRIRYRGAGPLRGSPWQMWREKRG